MSRYGAGGGGTERWDPERFNRERFERSRGPSVVERDRFFEERDRYADGGERIRERSVDEFYSPPRRAPARVKEEDRYYMEEKFSRPIPTRPRAGPGRFYDEVEEDEASPSRGQMVPFETRRKSVTEKFASPARRTAPRPVFIRRQSSLDTFDRKPMPRYGDRPYEPPEVIPVPIPRRRRSPPRVVERDYEEIRVTEPEYYPEDEYKYKEREIIRRRRADSEVREREVIEEREEIIEEKPEFPKRGKTKMPMRLINKRAIIELGYPFEEEGDTLIILKALGKDNIDEVIKISREYNSAGKMVEVQESRTTYQIEAPPPPPPPPVEERIIERRTEIIREDIPPPPEVPRSVREWDMLSAHRTERRSPSPGGKSRKSRAPSPSAKSHKSRARSASSVSIERVEIIRSDDREESGTVHGGPFALMAPSPRRDERSIKAEIRALEAEKKALKYEREMERERHRAERYRDNEVVLIKDKKDMEIVEIKKDKKVPDPRIIRAMLATLT